MKTSQTNDKLNTDGKLIIFTVIILIVLGIFGYTDIPERVFGYPKEEVKVEIIPTGNTNVLKIYVPKGLEVGQVILIREK